MFQIWSIKFVNKVFYKFSKIKVGDVCMIDCFPVKINRDNDLIGGW